MRNMRLGTVFCWLLTLLTACGPQLQSSQDYRSGSAKKGSDALKMLELKGQFKMLSSAMSSAGLVESLKGDGPFTVLAPNDQAFAKLGDDMVDGLLANPVMLKRVLQYHVMLGAMDADKAVTTGTVKTLNGDSVSFTERNGKKFVNGAALIESNMPASNGVVHVIDTVLMPPAVEAAKDIIDVASGDGRFSTLVTALKSADLVATLQGAGPFTVFAPTNDAFAKLGSDTINALLADKAKLSNILLYHVVTGAEVDSENASQLTEATMANGAKVTISLTNGMLKINDSTVIIKDIKASNGIIHVLDTVLLPPTNAAAADTVKDIVSIASSDSRFTTLVTALKAADLVSTLSGAGPFTVFAPTNDAFAKLGNDTITKLLADKAQLSNILLYHVVSGNAVDSQTASMLKNASVANGGTVQIRELDGKLLINDSMVVVKDIKASNGIIHVIDTVLIPRPAAPVAQDIVSIAKANGKFQTLTTALRAANLDTLLAGPGQFTVFAPTDAAFAKLGAATINALLADKTKLTNVLLYHVIHGFAVDSGTAIQLDGATMANHRIAHFKSNNGVLHINNAQVVIKDIKASNGIIHVIDTVLIP